MDNFLRSAIIYFQYYIQVWNNLQERRTEIKRKLRHPQLVLSENVIRDDLADLRSMLARDYAVLLTGLGDAKKFHHMHNENNVSLSDKDRKLFEVFVSISVQVVWIALKRKYMSLIDKEMNRMLRSPTFCDSTAADGYLSLPEEDRILQGKNHKIQRKLLQNSPLIQEIILENHDYRMLSIGISDVGISDRRLEYLQAAYSAPEELLQELDIGIGILGVPRTFFSPILKIQEISTTKKRESFMKPIPEFCIPPVQQPSSEASRYVEKKTCKYQETQSTKINRRKQCKLWKEHLLSRGKLLPIVQEAPSSTPSYSIQHSVSFSYQA